MNSEGSMDEAAAVGQGAVAHTFEKEAEWLSDAVVAKGKMNSR